MNKMLSKLFFAAIASTAICAQATTIDFTTLATGTAVTNQYAGVIFSLAEGNDADGAPTVGGGGLTNTRYSGSYPTARYLVAQFAPSVTNVVFTFNNAGWNGANAYTLYNASHDVITSGLMSGNGDITYDLSAYTGVSEVRWDNGLPGYNGNNWWQKLDSISYTAEVPEPGSFALFGLGIAAFAATRRKRNK